VLAVNALLYSLRQSYAKASRHYCLSVPSALHTCHIMPLLTPISCQAWHMFRCVRQL